MKTFILVFLLSLALNSCKDNAVNPPPVQNHSEIIRISYSTFGYAPNYIEIILNKDSTLYHESGYQDHQEKRIFSPMTQQLWDSLTYNISLSDYMKLDSMYINPDTTLSEDNGFIFAIWLKDKYKSIVVEHGVEPLAIQKLVNKIKEIGIRLQNN